MEIHLGKKNIYIFCVILGRKHYKIYLTQTKNKLHIIVKFTHEKSIVIFSPTELKAVVADLIEDRKRAKVPDSLQQLAIKCVLKNRCFFLDRHMTFFLGPEKLFANLGELNLLLNIF